MVCGVDCGWAHPGSYFLWSAFLASWEDARLACTHTTVRAVDQSSSLRFLTRFTGLPANYCLTFCLSFSHWHGLSWFDICTPGNKDAQITYWLDIRDCLCSWGYSTNPDHSWKRCYGTVTCGAYWQRRALSGPPQFNIKKRENNFIFGRLSLLQTDPYSKFVVPRNLLGQWTTWYRELRCFPGGK